MGGTFQVGPWSQKVDPPRLKKPKLGYTSSYMGWTRNKPASRLQVHRREKGPAEIGVLVQPRVPTWEVKT